MQKYVKLWEKKYWLERVCFFKRMYLSSQSKKRKNWNSNKSLRQSNGTAASSCKKEEFQQWNLRKFKTANAQVNAHQPTINTRDCHQMAGRHLYWLIALSPGGFKQDHLCYYPLSGCQFTILIHWSIVKRKGRSKSNNDTSWTLCYESLYSVRC